MGSLHDPLVLIDRGAFDAAPADTLVRHPEGRYGLKTHGGQWLEPGCADPMDDGWFQSMSGSRVLVWAGILDQASPWFGVVPCPDCVGGGWAGDQTCDRCRGGDTVQIGVRWSQHLTSDDDDIPEDELTERRAWDMEVDRIADHFEDTLREWAS